MSVQIIPPVRDVKRTEFQMAANADDVFSLICPMREHNGVEGWQTGIIWSRAHAIDGDYIFKNCVIPTERNAFWVTTTYDAKIRHAQFVKIVPDIAVMRLWVIVTRSTKGCRISATYSVSALSKNGERLAKECARTSFAKKFTTDWKRALTDKMNELRSKSDISLSKMSS